VTQGIRRPRPGGRASVMRALAKARPARLDPAAPPSVSWPPASHFTQLTRPRTAMSHPDASIRADRNRRPGRPQSPARPHQPRGSRLRPLRLKVLAAVSSAVAVGAVLILAVTLGGGPAQRPGRPGTPGHDRRSGTQVRGTAIRFQRLQLIRPWHGRIEFGIRGGVVYLTGFAITEAKSSTAITVLPPPIRPRAPLDIPIAAVPATALTMRITPDGLVLLLSGPRVSHVSQIWLSGVSFPLRS
jgi:hypothetical protein